MGRHSCRPYRFPTPPARMPDLSESTQSVLVPLNQSVQEAIDYRLYQFIHNSKRNDDDILSEIQNMRKKVAVQTKGRVFNGKLSFQL